MRVLVTGANGFIGSPTVKALLARGHEVLCSSRRPRASEGTEWFNADLLDPLQRRNLIDRARPEGLIHLAWETSHGAYWQERANLEWTSAAIDLVMRFWQAGGKRVLVAGTCAEYDWSTRNEAPFDELDSPLEATTLYGVCKGATYRVLNTAAQQSDLSLSWGRLFFVYGPGEPAGRFVPTIIDALLQRTNVDMTSGSQKRDFIYVRDAADALTALFDSPVRGAVNIGTGVPTSLREVGIEIARQLNGVDLLRLGAADIREDDPPYVVAATRRLTDEVGFSYRYGLKEGLREAIDFRRKGRTGIIEDSGRR